MLVLGASACLGASLFNHVGLRGVCMGPQLPAHKGLVQMCMHRRLVCWVGYELLIGVWIIRAAGIAGTAFIHDRVIELENDLNIGKEMPVTCFCFECR